MKKKKRILPYIVGCGATVGLILLLKKKRKQNIGMIE